MLVYAGVVLLCFTAFIFWAARVSPVDSPYPQLLGSEGNLLKGILLIVGTTGFLCSTFDSLIFASVNRFRKHGCDNSMEEFFDVTNYGLRVRNSIFAALFFSFALMSSNPAIYTSILGLSGSFVVFFPLLYKTALSETDLEISSSRAQGFGFLFVVILTSNFLASYIGGGDWVPVIILVGLLSGWILSININKILP